MSKTLTGEITRLDRKKILKRLERTNETILIVMVALAIFSMVNAHRIFGEEDQIWWISVFVAVLVIFRWMMEIQHVTCAMHEDIDDDLEDGDAEKYGLISRQEISLPDFADIDRGTPSFVAEEYVPPLDCEDEGSGHEGERVHPTMRG